MTRYIRITCDMCVKDILYIQKEPAGAPHAVVTATVAGYDLCEFCQKKAIKLLKENK